MLRNPPFNMQAVHMGESEKNAARVVPGATPLGDPVNSSQKEEEVAMTIISLSLVASKGRRGTGGLTRWRHAGLPRPELSHSGLSALQGRTHAQASCRLGAVSSVGVS